MPLDSCLLKDDESLKKIHIKYETGQKSDVAAIKRLTDAFQEDVLSEPHKHRFWLQAYAPDVKHLFLDLVF